MPYTIHTAAAHIRDNSGRMRNIDVFSDSVESTKEEALTEIENKKTEALEAIGIDNDTEGARKNALKAITDATTAAKNTIAAEQYRITKINNGATLDTETAEMIAEYFDPNKDYQAGTYIRKTVTENSGNNIINNIKLFKFISDHTAGAINDNEVEEIILGDELSKTERILQFNINNISLWEPGAINSTSGVISSDVSTTRIRTKDFCYLLGTIKVTTGFQYMLFIYDNDNHFQGTWNGTQIITTLGQWLNKDTNLQQIGDYKFKIVFAKTSKNENIGIEDAINLELIESVDQTLSLNNKIANAKTVGNEFIKVNNKINFLTTEAFKFEPIPITFTTGLWNTSGTLNTTGNFQRSSSFTTLNKKIHITITEGYSITIAKWSSETGTSTNFLGHILGYVTLSQNIREYDFEVNDGEYFRIGIKKNTNDTITSEEASVAIQVYELINRMDDKVNKEDNNNQLLSKLNAPKFGGNIGQILTNNGTNFPEWRTPELISGDEITDAVQTWLQENPQALIQLADKSIMEKHFQNTALRYITPEMFEDDNDDPTADDQKLQRAINYAIQNNVVLDGKGKLYRIKGLFLINQQNSIPFYSHSLPLRGLKVLGSITIQNMKLTLIDEANPGTSLLHLKCEKEERITLENITIDGNLETQFSQVTGDGNMTGIKVGDNLQREENPCGSIHINNCYIKNCYTDGITITTTAFSNLLIENCIIEGNGRNGITDNSLNGIIDNCLFINNGVRTDPQTQLESETEYACNFINRIIKNCIFKAGPSTSRDIVFLSKRPNTNIEHLIISNCICDSISMQSQTPLVGDNTSKAVSNFEHITISNCNCNTIRFDPEGATQQHEAYYANNKDMQINNCIVSDIIVTTKTNMAGIVGNLTINQCKIKNSLTLDLDNLIITNSQISHEGNAYTLAPIVTNSIIDNNILTNCSLNTTNITNTLGNNIIL